jgi:hypothetical protein
MVGGVRSLFSVSIVMLPLLACAGPRSHQVAELRHEILEIRWLLQRALAGELRFTDVGPRSGHGVGSGGTGDVNQCVVNVLVQNFPPFSMMYAIETGSGADPNVYLQLKDLGADLKVVKADGSMHTLAAGDVHNFLVEGLDGNASTSPVVKLITYTGPGSILLDAHHDASDSLDSGAAFGMLELTTRADIANQVVVMHAHKDGEGAVIRLTK